MTEHDILDRPVRQFLDQLAQRSPAPGGGSVAALAGALACAMARMVVAYSKSDDLVVAKAGRNLQRADDMLRRLVDEDIAAYQVLTAAQKTPQSDSGDPQGALITAALVPAEMAAVATQALAAMDAFKAQASKFLISDLGVAACLARACVQSAGFSVRINLTQIADPEIVDKFSSQITELNARADALAAGITHWVNVQLQPA